MPTGGVSELTVDQQAQLKRFLKKNMQRTAMEIRDHIQTVYLVRYSVIGTTKLLHRIGFVYKKPKTVPGKANDKWVKTNTGRQRLNLNGALNLKTHHAVVLVEETINATSVIRLGNALLKKHKRGNIYVILDNAKYHHAKLVKVWRKTHGRIKFLFLPPYSPNFNLIERLWRFFHQKVTWNRYFESFEQFKNESLGFFKNLKQYDKELTTLLADNFQVVPSQKLQT